MTDDSYKIAYIRKHMLEIQNRVHSYIYSQFISEIMYFFFQIGFQNINAFSFNTSINLRSTNSLKRRVMSETVAFTSSLKESDCGFAVKTFGFFSDWLSNYKNIKEQSPAKEFFGLCDEDFYIMGISQTPVPEKFMIGFISNVCDCFSAFLTDLYLDSYDPMELMKWIRLDGDTFSLTIENYIPRKSLKCPREYR